MTKIFGTPHQPVQLYHPFNNRECPHCHPGARSFEQGHIPQHDLAGDQDEPAFVCHFRLPDMVHNVAQADRVKYWSPPTMIPVLDQYILKRLRLPGILIYGGG